MRGTPVDFPPDIRDSQNKNIDNATHDEMPYQTDIRNSRIKSNGQSHQPAVRSQASGSLRAPRIAESTRRAWQLRRTRRRNGLGGLCRARIAEARLVSTHDGWPLVLKSQLKEFVLYGAKYAFPAVLGALSRRLPTGYAVAPLNKVIVSSADPVPVWPHPNEPVRGMCLAPLYPSVLEAAMRDEKLYAKLSLFDALRAGQARERAAAKRLLKPYFK